jgi:hypothetical protein
VLGSDFSASIEAIKKLLDGSIPALPRFGFNVVDVRDIARLHVLAMTAPEAAGAFNERKGVRRLLHASSQQWDHAPLARSQAVPMIDAGRQISRQDGHSARFATSAANDSPELLDGLKRLSPAAIAAHNCSSARSW